VRPAPLVLVAGALIAGGCGSGSGSLPGLGDSGKKASASTPAAVIRGWSDALRGGDIDRASGYFAVPSVVENGSPPVELHSLAEAKIFNRALPCGARYLRSTPHHGYVIAEFRLTDRTGPGAMRPCQGKGAKADVAFRITHGKIAEWRRAAGYPGEGPQDASPAGNNFT
jgi:hypothetical protein